MSHGAVAIGSREAELPERLGIPCRIIFNSAETKPRFLDFPPLAPVRFGYFRSACSLERAPWIWCARRQRWLRPCAGRMPVCIYTEATRFRPAPLQRRMQGTIEHNSLGDIIFIHDWTDNVEEAVRSVHCIVRPDPTGSPWGRDIIEAMSMGRPVIAAGEEEVFIKPGKNGLAGTPRRYRSPRRNLERPFALRHGTGKNGTQCFRVRTGTFRSGKKSAAHGKIHSGRGTLKTTHAKGTVSLKHSPPHTAPKIETHMEHCQICRK